jgi:type II secretory pathway component GspD/PulD (secretin)
MSVKIGRRLGQVLAAALSLAAGLLPATAFAQAPRGSDLLEQYSNRNAVAAQQLENEIHDAVVDAQRLAQADPAKAVDRLKRALARLDDHTVLTPSRRDSLVRDLKERIRVFETDGRRAAHQEDDRAQQAVAASARKQAEDRDAAEQEKVSQLLSNVRALQREGRAEEANRMAQDIAARYPGNLAAQVAARTTSMTDAVNTARQTRSEGDRRRMMVYQDVDRSAMQPIGDIEFPKDWAEKSKMRKARMNPLSAAERAILEALNKPISLDVREVKLDEVLDELGKLLGQPLVTDEDALKQLNIGYDSTVSVRAKRPVAARTVLRQTLSQLGLTYVIKDQAIYITTPEKAKQMMVVRTYYLGDLMGTMDLRLPPVLNQLQMAQNVAYIVDLIKRSVDPDSWADNGRDGQGTIAFEPLTMSLVVRQSAEVHFMLGGSFR